MQAGMFFATSKRKRKTYGGEKGAISGAVFSVRLLGYGYTVHYRSWCSRGIET